MCSWQTILLFLTLLQTTFKLDCTIGNHREDTGILLFSKPSLNTQYQELLKLSLKQLNRFLEVPNSNWEFLSTFVKPTLSYLRCFLAKHQINIVVLKEFVEAYKHNQSLLEDQLYKGFNWVTDRVGTNEINLLNLSGRIQLLVQLSKPALQLLFINFWTIESYLFCGKSA